MLGISSCVEHEERMKSNEKAIHPIKTLEVYILVLLKNILVLGIILLFSQRISPEICYCSSPDKNLNR
jgi:hypothetical protein